MGAVKIGENFSWEGRLAVIFMEGFRGNKTEFCTEIHCLEKKKNYCCVQNISQIRA